MNEQIQKIAAAAAIGRMLAKVAFNKAMSSALLQKGQSVARFGTKYTGRISGVRKLVSIDDLVAPVAKV